MLRFFFMIALLLFIGSGILSLVNAGSIAELLFFVFGILAVAIVCKVVLDFVLFYKKEGEEDEAGSLFSESQGRTFSDLDKFSQALKKKYQKRR